MTVQLAIVVTGLLLAVILLYPGEWNISSHRKEAEQRRNLRESKCIEKQIEVERKFNEYWSEHFVLPETSPEGGGASTRTTLRELTREPLTNYVRDRNELITELLSMQEDYENLLKIMALF